MKHVDRIIQYLSGDLSDAEKKAFEEELNSDPRLSEEYEEVSRAYNLVSSELKKRDEAHFRAALNKVMLSEGPSRNRRPPNRRPRLYLLIPVAASLALLLTLYLVNRLEPAAFSRFYKPDSDRVLLALSGETRGSADSGIQQYRSGNYQSAYEKLDQIYREDAGNHQALLFLLLAAIELDRSERIVGIIRVTELDPESRLDQCLSWYTSLAMLKNGRTEEAASMLQPLVSGDGPYFGDAQKLLKRLSK